MPSQPPGHEPGVELLAGLRPYVRHCGDERRGAWRLAGRRLLDYLLVAIVEGRGRFRIAGRTWEAGPGDLFWIPPATEHEMEGYPPSMLCPYVHFDLCYRPAYSHWDFSIPGGTLDLSPFGPLAHPPAPPLLAGICGRIEGPGSRRVALLLSEICAEAARAQPYAGLRMSGLLTEAIAEVLRCRASGGDVRQARLAAALDLVRRDPRASVAAMARACRLSPGHFRAVFLACHGLGPRAYLRRARVRRAKELMLHGTLGLAAIAERCGFANVHGFSRAFSAEEGISPSAWRRADPVRIRVEGREAPYPH